MDDYLPPDKYLEMKEYISKYHPRKLIPFELGVRSFLRIGETGITPQKGVVRHTLSDKTCREQGLPLNSVKTYVRKGTPVYPSNISRMRNGFAQITIVGKNNKRRTVPTPFTVDELKRYYETSAQITYRQLEYLWTKFGIRSHKGGRATGIINYWLVNPIKDMGDFFEIKTYSGHKSIIEMEPYLEGYHAAKNIVTDEDLEFIRTKMLNHFSQ